jgi:hypothetical protein
MIQLIGGANGEGYTHALMKVWNGKLGIENMPDKSALCRMRERISWLFFKDQFVKLIKRADTHRKAYLGLKIYAIDGQMLTLPRSAEIIEAGFTGRAVSKYRESYMPRGFLTHAYDVITGVSKDFRFTNRLNEQQDAQEMIPKLEVASLTIYDRLYFCTKLIKAHYDRGNHFLFRCRRNACKEIQEFYNDAKKSKTKTFLLRGKYEVHLIRIPNYKTKQDDVFATSLNPALLRANIIKKLYRLRWEIETSFLELTGITKAEQWHSKSVNGIYQEIYARFWLINYTKLQMHVHTQKPENPLRDEYERPNFKLLYNFILLVFPKILKRNPQVLSDFKKLSKKSTEKRKHHKRSYKREIKTPASPYKYNNTRWTL